MTETSLNLLTFDRIEAGKSYADRVIEVGEISIANYTRAVRDAAGLESMPNDAAPFMLPVSWTIPRVSFDGWQVPGGGIHARQSWKAFAPLPTAGPLRLRTTAVEKFHKNDRPYVVFESILTGAEGKKLGEGRMTIAWPE